MGLKLIASGTTAPWYTKVVPPVTRGLEGWFNFDTDVGRFGFNRAIGKPDASIIGTPEAYEGYGRFKGLANFIQTEIGETADLTMIVVGRVASPIPASYSNEDLPYYMGNYLGSSVTDGYSGTARGASLYHGLPTTLTATGARDNGSGGIASTATNLEDEVPTDWAIRASRVSVSGGTTAHNLTKGLVSPATVTRARVLNDRKFMIGSGVQDFGGEVDISVAAFYSVALTDAEIAQVAAVMRKRMTRLGITV